MSTAPATPPAGPAPEGASQRRVLRRARGVRQFGYDGQPFIWLTGGGLALSVLMIASLLVLIAWQGFNTFWPVPAPAFALRSGETRAGEVTREERYRPRPEELDALPAEERAAARATLEAAGGWTGRRLVRTGNFEETGTHFQWISDFEIAARTEPEWALVVERLAWGRFYGELRGYRLDGADVASTPAEAWERFERHHAEVRERWREARRLEKHGIGRVNRGVEEARLELRALELRHGAGSPEVEAARARLAPAEAEAERRFAELRGRIDALDRENARHELVALLSDGREKSLPLAEIVRAYAPNRLGTGGKLAVYLSRWAEFLGDDPREANSEGGVFPAIFGTVTMTLVMSLLVAPFGVLAALYLREYAKAGPVVSAVRIAINNLAGVPSIVFGVFGLGFFCYIVGGSIDSVFFAEKLPSPTFGTGGLLWASLTLALLTLPVVIVATEEAIAAVPRSMREGSYACGASKWQTIQRIVLRRAMPGIMTGMILAMARGAGEVAPLMLVGAVKLAPELPLDAVFPFVHPERSFMHLGFHIYDVGFQGQNSEAGKPMVFTTTLLLITLIFALNLAAIWLRSRLQRRLVTGHF